MEDDTSSNNDSNGESGSVTENKPRKPKKKPEAAPALRKLTINNISGVIVGPFKIGKHEYELADEVLERRNVKSLIDQGKIIVEEENVQ